MHTPHLHYENSSVGTKRQFSSLLSSPTSQLLNVNCSVWVTIRWHYAKSTGKKHVKEDESVLGNFIAAFITVRLDLTRFAIYKCTIAFNFLHACSAHIHICMNIKRNAKNVKSHIEGYLKHFHMNPKGVSRVYMCLHICKICMEKHLSSHLRFFFFSNSPSFFAIASIYYMCSIQFTILYFSFGDQTDTLYAQCRYCEYILHGKICALSSVCIFFFHHWVFLSRLTNVVCLFIGPIAASLLWICRQDKIWPIAFYSVVGTFNCVWRSFWPFHRRGCLAKKLINK